MTPLKHVGFIMDGNGRWASSRGLQRIEGYAEGLNALKKVLSACVENEIEAVTVYAFSTENSARPAAEINAVEEVVKTFNLSYEGDYKISYMGDVYSLNDALIHSIEAVEKRTFLNCGLKLNIAFNYGGRADIVAAAKRCCDHGEFDEIEFERNLNSAHLPALDLIVRTGGEKRLSNFMLYEAAYAELIFLDKYWPDMNEEDVRGIVDEFNSRKRKFGK